MSQLLVVDDDPFLLDSLKRLLESEGYCISTAASGDEALLSLSAKEPCLAVLDVSLPDFDGMTLCRRIRKHWQFPILILSARSDATSKVSGLELGADDYLTKPFDPGELVARIRALLRRSGGFPTSEKLVVGELVIDLSSREVIAERPIPLTLKEFELLAHLAKNLGRVVTRAALFEHSWGYELSFDSNSLDVHIYRLRKKIEPDPSRPRYLHTVKGYGYRLADISPDQP